VHSATISILSPQMTPFRSKPRLWMKTAVQSPFASGVSVIVPISIPALLSRKETLSSSQPTTLPLTSMRTTSPALFVVAIKVASSMVTVQAIAESRFGAA
jgi:hypothetical protein